jgi:hypothetical protein
VWRGEEPADTDRLKAPLAPYPADEAPDKFFRL